MYLEDEYPDITNVKFSLGQQQVLLRRQDEERLEPTVFWYCLPPIDSPPRSQSLSVSAKEVVEIKATYEIAELDVDDSEILSFQGDVDNLHSIVRKKKREAVKSMISDQRSFSRSTPKTLGWLSGRGTEPFSVTIHCSSSHYRTLD